MNDSKLPIKLNIYQSFYKEEIIDGYLVKAEVKELWAVLLDLLNEFMNVCDKHNIHYYACAGTILGAVRHKGMIPWDNDIDIMMFREDYQKLCSIASSEFKHPYFFQTEYTDKWSLRGHAQLRNSQTTGMLKSEGKDYPFNQGIFIDIFPLDNTHDSKCIRIPFYNEISEKRYNMLFGIRKLNLPYNPKFRKNIFAFVFHYIKHYIAKYNADKYIDKKYSQLEQLFQKYNATTTKDVMLTPLASERYSWPKSLIKGEPIYTKFAMLEIPIPHGYNEILEKTYGNWKEFVIGNSVHDEIIFDTHKSYRDYVNE